MIRLKRGLLSAIGLFAGYGAWVLAFRMFVLTLVIYLLIPSAPRLGEISEVYSSHEVGLLGLAAVLFLVFLCLLNPVTTTHLSEIISWSRIRKMFIPGFLQGFAVSSMLAIAFLSSGFYEYLGVFVQLDEAPLTVAGIILRAAALIGLAYSEEFIFRFKIMTSLGRVMPFLGAIVLNGILYCIIKVLQFDLEIMELLTLFILSLVLSMRTAVDGDFINGAGFWSAILVVLQPLYSLRMLGNEFQGVFLTKHVPSENTWIELLNGGSGGPLASVITQAVLLLVLAQSIVKYRSNRR